MGLLFLHGMAMAVWFVPLGSVLDAADLGSIKPMAFAASAFAALLSPLLFGAIADRSVPPAKVLRWISAATGIVMCLIAWSIEWQVSGWAIWMLIQVQSLFCSPTSSLAGSIVFAQLVRSKRSYGLIRSMGTIGWMTGCWTTSLLGFDASPHAFFVSGSLFLFLAFFTLRLPHHEIVNAHPQKLTLRERFGWDALSLLRHHDHRVVFVTAALLAVPFAAFYPFTPPHLSDLGMEHISAWMSLGQVSEVIALMSMGAILGKWKFKWIVTVGIGFGVLRYGLYAINSTVPVLFGLTLHGFAFTLTYISTQIYLAERIEAGWRTRAQALLSLMTSGFGNLVGYLGTGVWLTLCSSNGNTDWSVYWGGLTFLVLIVLLFFVSSYHGKPTA